MHIACKFAKKGTCKFGNECNFRHFYRIKPIPKRITWKKKYQNMKRDEKI